MASRRHTPTAKTVPPSPKMKFDLLKNYAIYSLIPYHFNHLLQFINIHRKS